MYALGKYLSLDDEIIYPDYYSKAKVYLLRSRVYKGKDAIPGLTKSRSSIFGLYQLSNNNEMQDIEIDALKNQNIT